MQKSTQDSIFSNALGIKRNDVVAIIGSGGKTSLMFRLAWEGMTLGLKVLVTTSTKIFIPEPSQYTAIDLSGQFFSNIEITEPGVYVGGIVDCREGKVIGVAPELLAEQVKRFDLVLIEADGAAMKSLKGWKATEPVIPHITQKTIAVIDIQAIGQEATAEFIHRFDIFSNISGAKRQCIISTTHILNLIRHPEGLFGKAQGEKILYLNKTETALNQKHAEELSCKVDDMNVVAGSIKLGKVCFSTKRNI